MQKWNFINVYGGQGAIINMANERGNSISRQVIANDRLHTLPSVISHLAGLSGSEASVSIENMKMLIINNGDNVTYIPDNHKEYYPQKYLWAEVDTQLIEQLAADIRSIL